MSSTSPAIRSASWPSLLAGVISESTRILSAHSRHFLALSVLFLLPLSSLLIFSPFPFPSPITHHSPAPPQSLLRSSHSPFSTAAAAAALLLSLLAAALLFSLASAAVSQSSHSAFFARPVNLLPTLRALPLPLLRLLLTLLSSLLPFLLLFSLLLSLRLAPLPPLAFSISALAFALVFVYLIVTFSLAPVVAVLEQKWGFEPLRRSVYLVKGMRWAALCVFLFFSVSLGVVIWRFSLGRDEVVCGEWREVVAVVARTAFGSAVTVLLLLYGLVVNAVMYMYCKALRGELAGEIAEEFAWEYVCLPFDEEKVPRVVSVVQQ